MTYQPSNFIIGLDLGKKKDYTALVVLKRTETVHRESHYDLIHLDRWRGRDYLSLIPVVHKVSQDLMQVERDRYSEYVTTSPSYWNPEYTQPLIDTVVDQTGVGESVVESMRAGGLDCYGIMIHGGENVTKMDGGWRVPKRELVGTLEVLLQNRRLQFADSLPMKEILTAELESFKATIKLSGHVSYAASEEWREGEHDDTVLALALAAWFGEQHDPHAYDDLDAYYQRQGIA